MKIRNINGTAVNLCKCGSWLTHWMTFSDQDMPVDCPERDCVHKVQVGAHVQKDDANDNNWYIIPLCKEHNAKTGESLVVSDYVRLVKANVAETCGK